MSPGVSTGGSFVSMGYLQLQMHQLSHLVSKESKFLKILEGLDHVGSLDTQGSATYQTL